MFGSSFFGTSHFGASYFPPDEPVSGQAGFITPLPFWAGGAVTGVTQGGFRTPLPTFPAGATTGVVQGGYQSLMAFWSGGGGTDGVVEPIIKRGSMLASQLVRRLMRRGRR